VAEMKANKTPFI